MTTDRISEFTSERARTKFLAAYQSAFDRLWTVDVHPVDVPTTFGTTRVNRSGPAEGIPFVLLPGAGGNSLMWCHHVAGLSQDRPVIAIDPVGEPGRSTQDKPILDAGDLVRWLDEVLSALDVDRAHFIGCSYGGWVALRHEIASPGRAVTITLLDPAGFGRITARFLAWVILGGLAAFAPAPLRHRAARWLHNATLLDDEAMGLVAVTVPFRRRLPQADTFTDDELRGIDVPVLVLLGGRSQMYPATEVAARIEALIPAARAEVVSGASHDLPVHSPELVVDRATAFADGANHSP